MKKTPVQPTEPVPARLVASSDSMQSVLKLIQQAASAESPVLLIGEVGTGKTTLASILHQQSLRAAAPLITLNCSRLTDEQLEQHLFGRGVSSGCLELARHGTLFLNEVHHLSPRLQSRLLGFLQQGWFDRLGETNAIEANVRMIAASDQDLGQRVKDGTFREDLFWRLSVFPIAVPPLRRRKEDLPELVAQFLAEYSATHQKPVLKVDPEAMKALQSYTWPGNLLELQTYLQRAVILATGNRLTPDLLPKVVLGDSAAVQSTVFRPTDEQSLIHEYVYHRISKLPKDANDLHQQIVEPVERELFAQIMEACQHTQTKAANRLGINRNTLYKKLVEYGLTKPSDE